MEKIPVYNCIVDESGTDESGIYAMSFVDCPANETDFVALSKEVVHLNKDSQKQILTGVVLKPEQLIYRNSEKLGAHYIKFSSDEIEKISRKMMKTGIALHCTTHQHDNLLSGNYLVELWIVENPDNDKSNALGFKNLPKGTLMCSYKIEDRDYWDSQVMTGNVKGFSLEGLFMQNLCVSNKNTLNMKKKTIKLSFLQKAFLKTLGMTKQELEGIESVEIKDETDSGETFVEFVLSDGQIVLVDVDGFATMDGEQMPAGEHKLSNGNILVIDENGNFVETKEVSEASTDPEEATAAQTLRIQKHNLAKQKAKINLEETAVETEDIETLKAKIAELEAKIAELSGLAQEAQTEVAELRKQIPSATPVVQKQELNKTKPISKMKKFEVLALSAEEKSKRQNY